MSKSRWIWIVALFWLGSNAHAMMLSWTYARLESRTCMAEVIAEGMQFLAEKGDFATEADAKKSLQTALENNSKWHERSPLQLDTNGWEFYCNEVCKSGSYRDLRPLDGGFVAGIRLNPQPKDPKRPYETFIGMYLGSLQDKGLYNVSQGGVDDRMLVLGRDRAHKIPVGEVRVLYRKRWQSVAVTPRLTGEPLIDRVPTRTLPSVGNSEKERNLAAARASLSHLPSLGYKKLVFDRASEPDDVQEKLIGKFLAGVCQDPTNGTMMIFAGKVHFAKERVSAYGWRDRPETYNDPTAWGIAVTIDGAFGNQWIDFQWCPALWIHDGSGAATPFP
jgi:hypothetical protein